MAARGDGVEGDKRAWVVVVGRGEPEWRLSVQGEFGGGNGGGRELFWHRGGRGLVLGQEEWRGKGSERSD